MSHPSMMTLRKLHAGESDAAAAHVATCEVCAAKMKGLHDEQLALEQVMPFEKFAAGVEGKGRPRQVRPERWVAAGIAVAATLALVFAVMRSEGPTSRIKGSASVDFVVGGGGGQRAVTGEPEALAPGERVRVGLTAGAWSYAMVVSIDERGTLTPIYLENGRSLTVNGTAWLPDSLEFTGQGLERIVVVLSQSPLTLETVSQATKTAYEAAHGDLTRMPTLDLPGEQFQRTFLKP